MSKDRRVLRERHPSFVGTTLNPHIVIDRRVPGFGVDLMGRQASKASVSNRFCDVIPT